MTVQMALALGNESTYGHCMHVVHVSSDCYIHTYYIAYITVRVILPPCTGSKRPSYRHLPSSGCSSDKQS